MTDRLTLESFSCRAVHELQMSLAPGECMGVTGPSGVGKSQFLRAVADLEPYEGRMLLDGLAADQILPPLWRRQVGLLPAESAWWFDTVGEHFERMPTDWLAQLGFDKQIGEWQIGHLSSGERQRLALVRLLLNRPKVLLLDEPTANLDVENIHRVESVLAEFRTTHHPGIIWVGHDLEQLKRWCDRIFILRDKTLTHLDSVHTSSST
jgi:ABC-type multidrug transport system ATPase subunit